MLGRKYWGFLVVGMILSLMLLSGCGSSSDGDSSSTSTTAISGSVVDPIITGASGNATNAAGGVVTGTSGSDGSYTFNVEGDGPFVLQFTGGTEDYGNGTTTPFNGTMKAIVPTTVVNGSKATAHVTALSTVAADLAASFGGTDEDALQALSVIQSALGLGLDFDILGTSPIVDSSAVVEGNATATQANIDKIIAMRTAAEQLRALVRNATGGAVDFNSANFGAIATMIALDAADGVLDGNLDQGKNNFVLSEEVQAVITQYQGNLNTAYTAVQTGFNATQVAQDIATQVLTVEASSDVQSAIANATNSSITDVANNASSTTAGGASALVKEPASRIELSLSKGVVLTGSTGDAITATVKVYSAAGNLVNVPSTADVIVEATSGGSFGATNNTATGTYVKTFTTNNATSAITISAYLRVAPSTLKRKVISVVDNATGIPSQIVLTAPSLVTLSGGGEITFSANVTDLNGGGLSDQTVVLSIPTGKGTLSETAFNASNTTAGLYTLTTSYAAQNLAIGGQALFTAAVRNTELSDSKGSKVVWTETAPFNMTLAITAPKTVRIDETSKEFAFTLTAKDINGTNAVDTDVDFVLSADVGSITQQPTVALTNGVATFNATYAVPTGAQVNGTATITLTANGKNSSPVLAVAKAADFLTFKPAAGSGPAASIAVTPTSITATDMVTLDGTGSTNAATYAWSINSTDVTIGNASSATAFFIAPNVATSTQYTVTLTVTDESSQNDTTTAVVTVAPQATQSFASQVKAAVDALASSPVQIDVTNTDNRVKYQAFSSFTGAEGTVFIDSMPTFGENPPAVGPQYYVKHGSTNQYEEFFSYDGLFAAKKVVMIISNGTLLSDYSNAVAYYSTTIPSGTPEENVNASTKPEESVVSVAGGTVSGETSLTTTLTATVTGTATGYQWYQLNGTVVTLSNATAAQPTFTAPATAQTMVFAVVVTGGSNKDVAYVTVNISPSFASQVKAAVDAIASSPVAVDVTNTDNRVKYQAFSSFTGATGALFVDTMPTFGENPPAVGPQYYVKHGSTNQYEEFFSFDSQFAGTKAVLIVANGTLQSDYSNAVAFYSTTIPSGTPEATVNATSK